MTNIQRKLAKWGKRNAVSRRLHANSDKATMASWRLELDKSLQVFKVRSVAWMRYIVNLSRSEGIHDQWKCDWVHCLSKHLWCPKRGEPPHSCFWRPSQRVKNV